MQGAVNEGEQFPRSSAYIYLIFPKVFFLAAISSQASSFPSTSLGGMESAHDRQSGTSSSCDDGFDERWALAVDAEILFGFEDAPVAPCARARLCAPVMGGPTRGPAEVAQVDSGTALADASSRGGACEGAADSCSKNPEAHGDSGAWSVFSASDEDKAPISEDVGTAKAKARRSATRSKSRSRSPPPRPRRTPWDPSEEENPWEVSDDDQEADLGKESCKRHHAPSSPSTPWNGSVEGSVLTRSGPLNTWGPDARTLERPLPLRGCEHWQDLLWTSMETNVRKLKASTPKRPMRYESTCTGLAGENIGFEALGMDVAPLACAERKPSAQRYLKHQFGNRFIHCFTDNAAFVAGHGECFLHGRDCPCPAMRPDISIHGLPCQAYSWMRQRSGSTKNTGQVWQHPGHEEVFEGFHSYLRERQPLGWIVEEVPALAQPDKRTGISFLQTFLRKCRSLGYCVVVLQMDHVVWVEMSRNRLWMIGFSEELGHKQAADAFLEIVEESQKFRQLGEPTHIWNIVSPNSDAEMARRQYEESGGAHGQGVPGKDLLILYLRYNP